MVHMDDIYSWNVPYHVIRSFSKKASTLTYMLLISVTILTVNCKKYLTLYIFLSVTFFRAEKQSNKTYYWPFEVDRPSRGNIRFLDESRRTFMSFSPETARSKRLTWSPHERVHSSPPGRRVREPGVNPSLERRGPGATVERARGECGV